MRPAFLFLSCLWAGATAQGQMTVATGTGLVVDPGTSLRIDAPLTWDITAGSDVVNNGAIVLGPQAELNEAPGAAITGTGTERTTRDLSTPLVAADPGGLGGVISTATVLGNTLVVRGHIPFTDYSGHTSIARWIDFDPTNNSGLDATLALRYDPNELNGMVEADQVLHVRAHDDVWSFLPGIVDGGAHTITSTGLDSLGLFTTFEEDLPNAMPAGITESAFALLGAPGEKLYLRVPTGGRAETLDVFAMNGALIATLAPNWGEGTHALPELPLASGVYQLQVNGQRALPFFQP